MACRDAGRGQYKGIKNTIFPNCSRGLGKSEAEIEKSSGLLLTHVYLLLQFLHAVSKHAILCDHRLGSLNHTTYRPVPGSPECSVDFFKTIRPSTTSSTICPRSLVHWLSLVLLRQGSLLPDSRSYACMLPASGVSDLDSGPSSWRLTTKTPFTRDMIPCIDSSRNE